MRQFAWAHKTGLMLFKAPHYHRKWTCQIWLPCSALYVTYTMYKPCKYCGISCLSLPFCEVMADGEGHIGTRCICSFNSLRHTGGNTLYMTCHQYMLAHKRFTVQTWAECRCTHVSNMLQTIPRVHTVCHSAAVCFMHPTYACGTLSTHLCVVSTAKHNHENHHSAVIH